MNPFKRSPRRTRKVQFQPEPLEPRALLTSGAGDTFAIIPGAITTVGETTSIPFTIDPANFTLPKGKIALGVDVAVDSGATVKPFITSITDPHGNIVPQAFHSVYAPHVSHSQVANGNGTSAVLVPITLYPHQPSKPITYTVDVDGEDKSVGNFLVGFYLPGDANGDGKVDKSDLATVKSELGAKAGSSKYTFSADANRDGRIGKIDIAYALQNMGVGTTVSPVVQANLDPNSVTSPSTRATTNPTATFTGTATPGSTITYTNTSSTTPSVTTTIADPTGNYSIQVGLVLGSNVFSVQSKDSFGQDVNGTLNPVSYNPS
ncbi:dockerin type I domain-containing protein [Singulisphaera rosea]